MTNLESYLYNPPKSKQEIMYDSISCPRIEYFFSDKDIEYLYNLVTSIKYSSKLLYKRSAIEDFMRSKGFIKFHSGTNRLVFRNLENPSFVAKVALDSIGLKDNPLEFKNQTILKPFVAKTFQVSKYGVLGFSERVDPILNITQFLLVAPNIFDIIVFKILGNFIMDDIGSNYFMNWGIRKGMGPVLLDYPYLFILDSNKLYCNKPVYPNTKFPLCGGEIDYDLGFNNLICLKCGKKYDARDLAKAINDKVIIMKGVDNMGPIRVTIKRGGRVCYTSGNESDYIIESKGNNKRYYSNANKIPEVTIIRNNKEVYHSNNNIEKIVYSEKKPFKISDSAVIKEKVEIKHSHGGYSNSFTDQSETKEIPLIKKSNPEIILPTKEKNEEIRSYDLTKKENNVIESKVVNNQAIGFMSGIHPDKTYGIVSGSNTIKKEEIKIKKEVISPKEESKKEEKDNKQMYKLNPETIEKLKNFKCGSANDTTDSKEISDFYSWLDDKLSLIVDRSQDLSEDDLYDKLVDAVNENASGKSFFTMTPVEYVNKFLAE